MTDFASYYRTKFQNDLFVFFLTIPEESKFHTGNSNRETFTIQYGRLTRDCDHLDFLTKEDKINFGVALYFTVLVDMVCYSHFKDQYEKFRGLTLYPKFIGNCLHACHYHFNPSEIFKAMKYSKKSPLFPRSVIRLDFTEKFAEALPIMEEETREFFAKYLNEIDGQEFWDKCKAEVPFQ